MPLRDCLLTCHPGCLTNGLHLTRPGRTDMGRDEHDKSLHIVKEIPVAPSDAASLAGSHQSARREKPAAVVNPLRRTAMFVIGIAALLFVLSIFMERWTPSTSQSVVQAYV